MKRLVSLLLLSLATLATAAERKPNIIVIMPDDVGYGDFSCHGNPIIQTPSIDRLWAQSVRFTDFHVSPTCSPTRSALLTGRHEFRNGVTHTILERERLTPDATTLAQVLKGAGYATGIFGKWHLGDEPDYWPSRRGFDEMFIHGGGGIGQTYPGSCGDAPGNLYQDPAILHNGKFVQTQGYCTDVFFERATQWMDEHLNEGRPFFAYITPNAAHAPLQCPDDYFRRYAGKVPDDLAKFYGMIANIDDNVGRLLDKLDEWGIADTTLLIFLTDNGGTLGVKTHNGGRRAGKGTPYQGGTRVPSLWRWPARLKGGRDIAALTAHLDVLPTLAEFAGATLSEAVKKQVEGRSLAPLLAEPGAPWPDRTLVTHVGRWPKGRMDEWKYRNCSIRDARFTLVNNTELYDLATDPAEARNVFDAHPAEVARLRAAYEQWWAEIVPMQVNENATPPKMNPFKELYWKQFGGGPEEALRKFMDPATTDFREGGKRKAE